MPALYKLFPLQGKVKRIESLSNPVFRMDIFGPAGIAAQPGVISVQIEIVEPVPGQLVLISRFGVGVGRIGERTEVERFCPVKD